MAAKVIAVRDEQDAPVLDAFVLETRRRRQVLLEWWGGPATQMLSKAVGPDDVLKWPGWRPFTMDLPKDWRRGYLRVTDGTVEFVGGRQPRWARKHTTEEHETIRQAVEGLLRDIASRFPCAAVRTDVATQPGAEGLMELTCSLPETMRVAALAGAEEINLYLGERIWLELPITPKRSASGVLDEVRSKVEAAVAGRFEEKLCVWKGKVVASRYVLHSSGDRSQWPLRLRPIFMPGRRRITRYQPYG